MWTSRNAWGAVVHLCALCALWAATFFLYYNASKYFDVSNGLIICRNDCTNFHNYSNYIVEHKELYPVDRNFHSTYFYRGYTIALAALKLSFGTQWQIAYTAASVLLLFTLIAYAARCLAPQVSYWPKFFAGYALVSGNLNLLTYSRTLLSDFAFAVGACFFFLLLVSGLERRSMRRLVLAVVLAIALCFVRISGVFVLILAITAVGSFYLPVLRRRPVNIMMPIVAGLAVFVTVAFVTQALVGMWDRVENFPSGARGIANEILEVNYFGEDNLTPETRQGAILVEAREWQINDGTALGVIGAFVTRIEKIFEIHMAGFSPRNNAYRYLLYGALYAGILLFLLATWLERDERLWYLSLWIGYTLIFVTVSHVPIRYRLTFDLIWTLAAMSGVAWVWSRFRETAYRYRAR